MRHEKFSFAQRINYNMWGSDTYRFIIESSRYLYDSSTVIIRIKG